MLIRCPECELQVSNKAITCPHCGYPMKVDKPIHYRRSSKRQRLPNGFGQISEIKGRNLRKPFRAMVTVGKTGAGRPICKPLKPRSYFETYNEAYSALMEYNKRPYDLNVKITIKDLYDKWSPTHYSKICKSNKQKYELAWKYCFSVYDIDVRELRIMNIKYCMYESEIIDKGVKKYPSVYVQKTIKILLSKILDYAIEYEYVDRNVAREFKISQEVKNKLNTQNGHICFSDDEMKAIWKHENEIWADALLISCYSGWRPNELCELQIKNINIEQGSFTGGSKTEAGINRTIPIHSKISHIVKRYYDDAIENNRECLLGINYGRYRYLFNLNQNIFSMNHRLHDARVHFVSLAKKYKLDEYAIKYIVGHSIHDLTEKVYTKRSFEWLKEEIEKIKI